MKFLPAPIRAMPAETKAQRQLHGVPCFSCGTILWFPDVAALLVRLETHRKPIVESVYCCCSRECLDRIIQENERTERKCRKQIEKIRADERQVRAIKQQVKALRKFLRTQDPAVFQSLPGGYGPAPTSRG